MFKDAWNPTEQEIIEWAYHPKINHPQDWQLALTSEPFIPLLIKLAADSTCPTRGFFYDCLFVYIGDLVRTKNPQHRAEAKKTIKLGMTSPCPNIARWVTLSMRLIDHPEEYNYADWGLGGNLSQIR